ncbi:hypothetical protein WS97_00750 [Burkholderia territorii]|uniref:DUF3472 domain-containing protein n=1 Tax=Burkholderia territorii TaxID=1503055 RepID=UPI0007596AF8|nr:hypothetical protein [Burkholderia territorii]KVL25477.1 hypothetical protein WS97_00750 [Burkholderia territorii]KWO55211.1 hypothetical protein WT98_08875 [Burkholderia territorii]
MKFRLFTTTLRAFAFAMLFASSASWAITTTPSGSFVLSKGNNSSIDFFFNVQSDPGDKSYVFWAQQFWFETGSIGYLGLQRVAGTKKIIFSIWNATSSVALMQGAVAEPFNEVGTGQHVIAPFDWQLGHTYQFRLENAGGSGPWWEVSVTDRATNEHWDLGKIQAQAGWGNLQKKITTFTEVFINGHSCELIPYARAVFGPPTSDHGVGTTAQISAGTYGNFTNPCSLLQVTGAKDGVNVGTRSDVVGSSLVHQIGLSNGPRNWGDYDRQGKIGSIFQYQNPYSHQTEYFKLVALVSDNRYWYFPINETSNTFWQYLGTVEPFYNGPASHVWGENDRLGTIGDTYAYTLNAGITWYFRLTALDGNKRYGYFPTTPTNNSYWQYLGTNIGR